MVNGLPLNNMPNIPTANNNPGDLRSSNGSFNIGTTTPIQGQAALYNDLTAKMTGNSKTGINGNSTLYQFAQVYDPKGDGNNDPANYTAKLANQLGVSPDTKIGTLMPRLDDFAKAVATNEGYDMSKWKGGNPTASQSISPNPQQTNFPGVGALPASGSTPPTGGFPGISNLPNAANVVPPIGTSGTPTVQPLSAGQQVGMATNMVTGALGMNPLGQGLASAGRVISGHVNTDVNTQNQDIPQQFAMLKQLHQMVLNKVPANDPKRVQLENQIRQQSQLVSSAPTEAQIDPGTTLSDKSVLGSAAAVGGEALLGGSLPAEGVAEESGAPELAESFSRTPTESANDPLLVSLAKSGINSDTGQALLKGGGLIGNILRGIVADKVVKTTTGKSILQYLMKDL